MYPSSVDRLPVTATSIPQPSPSPRPQTVTNNLTARPGSTPSKDVNIRGGVTGSMDGVETVRVTDITSSSAFTKSIGSLFSSINKSVSSAFNSLMPAPPAAADVISGTPTHGAPGQAAAGLPADVELDNVMVSVQGLHHQQHQPQHHQLARDDRPYQPQVDWRQVQPQSYAEPSAYRGRHRPSTFTRNRILARQLLLRYCVFE